MAGDREGQADVDGAVAVRRRPPLADAGQRRPLGRRRRAGPGVVEATGTWSCRRTRPRPSPGRTGPGARRMATRVCVWTSTAPGRTSSPVASTTSAAPAAGPERSGSIASMTPPRTATSARRDPVAVTTVPPRTTSVGHSTSRDPDRLGALPEAAPAHLAQPVLPVVVERRGDDRREVVRRELAHLRRRRAGAVREEDLALADAARVHREHARAPGARCGSRSRCPAGSRRTGSTSTRRIQRQWMSFDSIGSIRRMASMVRGAAGSQRALKWRSPTSIRNVPIRGG